MTAMTKKAKLSEALYKDDAPYWRRLYASQGSKLMKVPQWPQFGIFGVRR